MKHASDASAPPDATAGSELTPALLRASTDALLDPQFLLEAARDASGQIVDFLYRELNQATCDYLGLSRAELIGRGVVETMPGIKDTLLPDYIRCLDTGEPLTLIDFSYDNEVLHDTRRYDLRATRATPTAIIVTWRDVTERFNLAQRAAQSEAKYHRAMDTAAVGMCLTTPDGYLTEVNDAICVFFGYDADVLIGMSWQELTAPDYLNADMANVEKINSGQMDSYRLSKQFIHADGRRIWGDLSVGCLRNSDGEVESFIGQITDTTTEVALAQELQRKGDLIAASERKYRLLADNGGDVVCHVREGRIVWASPSIEAVLGAPADFWLGRDVVDFSPPEDVPALTAMLTTLAGGGSVQERIRVVAVDGVMHWIDLHAKPFYDADGHQDGVSAALRLVDSQVAAEQAVDEARRAQARVDERYRHSIDNAAVGMCLNTPDGCFNEVNDAACRLFGYDAETLKKKSWQELTPPEYLEVDLQNITDLHAGRTNSFRVTKQFIHADGHLFWADLSVSCNRDDDGRVLHDIALFIDVTAQVRADERNQYLAQQLQKQTDRLNAELKSAANYMASIMPRGLNGAVRVKSRYLPSRELGGDCFDYTWIDDDHLLIYLIDVSGHGIEPALLSVSLHNMIRSGSLSTETVLAPEAVLAEFNHLFQMEQQNDHYFTMWFGVYETSSRTMRYSSAGHPPAFIFDYTTGVAPSVTELPSTSAPVGMFEETVFTSRTCPVPPGCRLLIYSDGANELAIADGRQLTAAEFKNLCTEVAGSPDWSLDGLIEALRELSPSAFEDDCSLIQVTFD
ncbi:MAG: PAS domain S-box protein [Mycobacterium sp.]